MTAGRAAARKRIDAIGAAEPDARALRQAALDVIGGVVDFDAYVWLLTDPVSTVGTAPLADSPCLSELPALIRSKYATPVNRWTALLKRPSPVALLATEVGNDLSRSRVWREVMSRYAIGDVASVVFADQFGCWSFLDLWRTDARAPFGPADAQFLGDVAPSLTTSIRTSQARTFVAPVAARRQLPGPVVLTLDDRLMITSRTAASQEWLDVLLPPRPDERGIPASVYNVAAQLLATEMGVDDHPAFTRTHLADGLWLTLRAGRLAGPDSSSIVVTLEEASAPERLELFGRAFGLTGREAELVRLLAVGSDTRAMARSMSISEHTVQDHLKAVFGKTGAHDRITVLSRALGTRAAPVPGR